jgi:hypothetical protein
MHTYIPRTYMHKYIHTHTHIHTYVRTYIHTYTKRIVRTHLVNLHPVTPVSFSLSRQQFVVYKDTLLLINLLFRLFVRKWHKNVRERAQTHTYTQAENTLTHSLSLTHSLNLSTNQPINLNLSIRPPIHPNQLLELLFLTSSVELPVCSM